MGHDSDWSDSDSLNTALSVTKRHLCHYEGCRASFSRPGRLRIHLDVHEGKKLFKCNIDGCNKSYSRNAHLKRHVTISHEEHTYVPVFTCKEPGCLRQLSSETNLLRHYQQVHCKPYSCETCGAGFNIQSRLATHVAIHTGILSFKCDMCEARFTRNHELKRHMRQHKTYPCPNSDCDSCYYRWSHLRKHLKLDHPPEFKCSDCPKVFTCKWKLKMHVQVHLHPLNREVLQCPHDKCPRFYFHKNNLMHHIKSSHEGRQFACDHPGCERTFCTKLKMQEHKKLHDPSARLPRRRCKSRRKRKDVGKPKRSFAVKLSGVSVPYHLEKHILECSSKLENLLMAEEMEELLKSEMCTTAVVDNSRPQNEGSGCENIPDAGEAHCHSHQWLEDVAETNIENACAEADSSTAPASDPRDLLVADADNPTNIDVASDFISSTEANFDRPCLSEDRDRSDITDGGCELDSNLQMLLYCSRLLAQNATGMKSLDQRAGQEDMSLQEISDPTRNSQESVASKTTPWLIEQTTGTGRRDACSPNTCERASHLNERQPSFDAQRATVCQNKNGKHLTKSRTFRESGFFPQASDELRMKDDTNMTVVDCADVGSGRLRTEADLLAWKYEHFVSSTVPSSEPDMASSSVSTLVRTRKNEDPGACVSSTVTESDIRVGTCQEVCDSRWQVGGELVCTDAKSLPSSQPVSRLQAGLCGRMDQTERAGSEEGGYVSGSSCENCSQCARCMNQRNRKRCSTSTHEAKMQLPRLFSVISTQQWLSAMLLAMRLAIPEIEDPILHQAKQPATRENSDFN